MSGQKTKLRKQFLSKREILSSLQVQQLSKQVFEKFINHEKQIFTRLATTVALYSPIRNEVDSEFFFNYFRGKKINCVFPVSDFKTKNLSFHLVESLQDLEEKSYKIKEPSTDSAQLNPDIIFVPGVVFSKTCYRLGYGAGFYDRLFARFKTKSHDMRPLLIGLAYDFQIVEDLPKEDHDCVLDFVISERFICQRNGT